MTNQKLSLSDYTYAEFKVVVEELLNANGTSGWQDRLLEHFIAITEYPEVSDLLYYPANSNVSGAEEIITRLITWRTSMGYRSFKDTP